MTQSVFAVPPTEAATGPRKVRVFVASPGDLEAERQEIEEVIRGLNETFSEVARLIPVRWEERSYTADASFQDQIPESKDCDVVVAIFGNRLGSPLRADFPSRMADGQPYASGTAYEVLSALTASAAQGRPTVYAFRKTTKPAFGLDERAAFDAAARERERVDAFIAQWFEGPDGASRRAVRPFATLAAFQREVRRALTDWLQTEFLGGRKPVWQIETEHSPFRGLEPFDARHARVFFGRDRKIARAMRTLTDAASQPDGRPFLLVVGASGAGKSSLVRAGLVPRLTAPGIVPGVDLWRVAVMRPGADASPELTLARRLLAGADAEDLGGFGQALPELAGQGFADPQHLADILASSPDAAAAILTTALTTAAATAQFDRKFEQTLQANLLLVVDQFEELFADTVTDTQRAAFGALLISLTWSRRIWVVATLRADLFARIIADRGFLELKDTGGQYDLASPGLDELAEIIHRSAVDTGLDYERDEQTGERLDERLLADATGADTLPLLQFALNELFRRRPVTEDGRRTNLLTYAAYQAIGGLDGVINSVAEQALADPQSALDPNRVAADLPRLLRSLVVRVHADRITAGAQATLTVCTAPLDAAQSEDGLIKALRNARILLTSDIRATRHGTMRIAHERVLTSWERAKEIIGQHLDYFRIAEDLDVQMRRWDERGQPRDLLLPPGSLLADAATMRRDYGAELSPLMERYIQASLRRERWRQGLQAGVMAVVFLFAVMALLFGATAVIAERQAVGNYTAARDAADTLVNRVGQEMRDLDGVNVKTLNTVFGVVQDLVRRIKQAVDEHDAGVPRPVQPFVRAITSVMGGDTGGNGDLNGLEGRMLWETAETYHQFKSDTPEAMQDAGHSLALRQQMWDAGDRSERLQLELGLSHRLLGDLSRIAAQQGGADLKAARAHYDAAFALIDPLYQRDPGRLQYGLGVTAVLSRLGDLDRAGGDAGHAQRRYEMERDISRAVFLKNTENVDARRELAWAFRKMGDYWSWQKQFPAARDEFTRELCVRRTVADSDSAKNLWQQDLGWSLTKLAEANLNAAPGPPVRDALFEAFVVRQRLALRDRNNATWQNEYATTLQALAAYYGTGGNPVLSLEFSMGEVQARHQAETASDSPASRKAADNAEQRLRQARQAYGGDPADITAQRAAQDIDIEQRSLNQQRQGAALAAAQNCWGELLTR